MTHYTHLPAELHFTDGLVGLPELHRFAVRPVDETAVVELVSLDDEAFGFAALPAEAVRPGYTLALRQRDEAHADDTVLVLLSAHGDPPVATANLAGPIVVAVDGAARQSVLEGTEFPLRAPVDGLG